MPVANQPIVTQRQMPAPPAGATPALAPVDTSEASQDTLSPTTLVMNYLRSKGMQPSNPNYAQAVRTALEGNARDPTLIPGLVNSTPSTEAQDQAAMAAARGGSGAGGKPNPFANIVNPTWQTTGPGGSSPATSTAPTGGSDGNLGSKILLGAGLPLAAAGAGYLGSKIPPMPDVAAGVPNAAQGGVNVPPATGNMSAAPTTGPTDMEMAMQRATAPASSPNLTGNMPPVDAATVGNARIGPATPDPAVINEGNIASGVTPAPQVPFNSQSPRTAPAVPTTTPTPTTDIPQVTVRAPRVAAPRVGRLILR